MDVNGCAAVITGGGTGMGAAVAAMLVRKGARVALLGRRRDIVEAKANEIGAVGIVCDVVQPDTIDAALDAAETANGPARILIHAAADGRMVPFLRGDGSAYPRDELRQIIETNVLGTLYMNQAIAARLSGLEPFASGIRGLIINVSSIGAEDGVVGSSYVMSKAAVNGLCLSLARELGPWGIRVVTIAPGAIDTEMFRAGANEQTHQLVASSVPCPSRIGSPEEFAALALHICENDYLNACTIRLDGGMRIPFVRNVGGGSELS